MRSRSLFLLPFPVQALTLAAGIGIYSTPSTQAAVLIRYELESGLATSSPLTIPNPDTGLDIILTPRLELTSGSFEATFPDGQGGSTLIADGAAKISALNLSGTISIETTSTIEIFGNPVPVSAIISGPLIANQVTDATGNLVGMTSFLDDEPGTYNVTAGPLNCSDQAFGLVCGIAEGLLGVEFPITQALEDTPLPFTAGLFSALNSPGNSTADVDLDFTLPLDDSTTFGLEATIGWEETDRMIVIPEATPAALLAVSLVGLIGTRRRVSSTP